MVVGFDKRSLDDILRNLNKEIEKTRVRTKGMMRQAVLMVKRTAQEKTPVDTGNLKASAFTDVYKEGDRIVGVIGYTASYALWVHEAAGKLVGLPRGRGRGFFWDPQGKAEPQFLRNALIENHYKIVNLFHNGMKI